VSPHDTKALEQLEILLDEGVVVYLQVPKIEAERE
jgi:hypothetical protein